MLDVRTFINTHYKPYYGDEYFLAKPTERTIELNQKYEALHTKEYQKGGVLDIDVSTVATILGYKPGYLDKDNEIIVGLQTDAPLKRTLNTFGGMRMAEQAAEAYGYKIDPQVYEQMKYRTTHNEGVFQAYTKNIRKLRSAHILTGLPDAYSRGRRIGDYRRVALYGTDELIRDKENDLLNLDPVDFSEETIRRREEISIQIQALKDLAKMAKTYEVDITKPATTAKEAIQAIYMAYLAAVKEQNGAAMSLGRVSTFIDIYIDRDLQVGILTEETAQELIDDFILHLRMVRQLRTPDYNDLFAGDPTWVTESLGGIGLDGRPLVTKTCFRILHTLENLGPAPEPNITILWSRDLPEAWKKYCAKISITTDSIQYENDDLMRERYGDDYAIACCVSAMKVGKESQYFGARCNLPKALLLAINNGKEEIHGKQIYDCEEIEIDENKPLDYETVKTQYFKVLSWLAGEYVKAMNIIHYMHDKYAYESIQMALHDSEIEQTFMAFGIAGISVVADSLAAIKYAQVYPIKNITNGIVNDFKIFGEYPQFGNDDDRVDDIAKEVTEYFYNELKKHKCYRNATHTLSLLTITSNVMYGRNTGATPCGRKGGEPFAPGANPLHGRDKSGAIFSLNSVAKLDYDVCRDGISNTFTINPSALGKTLEEKIDTLVLLMEGYFNQNAHHLNVNVFNRELLIDAQKHPELYPNLTIRVSGYAVKFLNLTKAQQDEVINRTCHSKM